MHEARSSRTTVRRERQTKNAPSLGSDSKNRQTIDVQRRPETSICTLIDPVSFKLLTGTKMEYAESPVDLRWPAVSVTLRGYPVGAHTEERSRQKWERSCNLLQNKHLQHRDDRI